MRSSSVLRFVCHLAFCFIFTAATSEAWSAGNSCVGNLVWEDTNGDGIKNNGERGYPGIEIRLTRNLVIVDSVVTSNGYFSLCSNEPGDFKLNIDIPDGYSISPQNQGKSDFNDSDADLNGIIEVTALRDRSLTRYDFGITRIPATTVNRDTDTQVDTGTQVTEPTPPPLFNGTSSVSFGVWVEERHRMDGVFGQFGSALTSVRTNSILDVLADARATNTSLYLQLGSPQEWGWNFTTNTGNFSLTRWKNSVNRFATDATLHAAIKKAIADGVIQSIYLIDEPHHTRWSPNGNSNRHITNADIDEMARHIKNYWPGAFTAVRASPRTLYSYGRAAHQWRYLDEAFLMINYRKWSKHGNRTLEGFMEREIAEANRQQLSLVGSIQMLIGAPASDLNWWPRVNGSQPRPAGKLRVSPKEMSTYFDAFLKPRNFQGELDPNGKRQINNVFVFRWDRNSEKDWENAYYKAAINDLKIRAQLF